MDRLSAMAAHAARRVERLKAAEPVEELRRRPLYARAPRPLPPGGWTDLRFADPEKGLLASGGEVSPEGAVVRARAALASGAACLGIWTERHFHAGDYSHLDAVRAALPDAPLVMLDFVVDPWQVERARAGGADGVLLHAEILGPFLRRVESAARDLGLTPVIS